MDFFADVMSLKDDRLFLKRGHVLLQTRPRFKKNAVMFSRKVVLV